MQSSDRFTDPKRLGFGTWQLGGANLVNGKPTGWGHVEEHQAIEAIHYALDRGIVFFDTADTYGRGQAERLLGRAFSTYGGESKPIVCTKFGNQEVADGSFAKNFSAAYLIDCVSASLERLQIDSLDTLLLHSPDDNFSWTTYDEAPYHQLLEQGLIRKFGVSSRSVYGAKRVTESGWGSVVELTYNALDRRAEEVLFTLPNIGDYEIIARVPLASGFLNGRYLIEDPEFRSDDYRSTMNPADLTWLLESVRNLHFLQDLEGGMAVSALRFALSNQHVSRVIPGVRSIENLKSNLKALELGPLPDEILDLIGQSVPDVPQRWKPAVV